MVPLTRVLVDSRGAVLGEPEGAAAMGMAGLSSLPAPILGPGAAVTWAATGADASPQPSPMPRPPVGQQPLAPLPMPLAAALPAGPPMPTPEWGSAATHEHRRLGPGEPADNNSGHSSFSPSPPSAMQNAAELLSAKGVPLEISKEHPLQKVILLEQRKGAAVAMELQPAGMGVGPGGQEQWQQGWEQWQLEARGPN